MPVQKFARPKILSPTSQAGAIGETLIPADLYFVSKTPSVIIGMAYPARLDFARLATTGVGHIVCLTDHEFARYDASPIRVTAIQLQDLWTAKLPADVELETERVNTAATAVVDSVLAGEGVAVHCHGGRGRTGTVLGVALVRLGHDPTAIVDYLNALHKWRSKAGWPESTWQAEVVMAASSAP